MPDVLPLGTFTSYLAMVLVMTSCVTSADSASVVMGSLTGRGSLHPPTRLVVTRCALMAAVAAVLLVAGAEVPPDRHHPGRAALRRRHDAALLGAGDGAARGPRRRSGPGTTPCTECGMRDAVRAVVGDAATEHGPERHPHLHPHLRRVAASRRRDRADPPDPGSSQG